MSSKQNPPFGPPGFGAAPVQPQDDLAPREQATPQTNSGYAQPVPPPPYAPAHGQSMPTAYPYGPYVQGQGYSPQPMQPVAPQPLQGYAPYPMHYGPPPINIVVQNTNGFGGGGIVRIANRNKQVAALLAIFLGAFGAHKFYLGQNAVGVLYLLFFWTGLPWLAGVLEGVGYLLTTDNGFDIKYNARLT